MGPTEKLSNEYQLKANLIGASFHRRRGSYVRIRHANMVFYLNETGCQLELESFLAANAEVVNTDPNNHAQVWDLFLHIIQQKKEMAAYEYKDEQG